nr:hypothetical protein [Tanacetum cinerariifolium]
MRTCSSSNLPVESHPKSSTSNPERRNRRRSKQPFILEESPVDTMADQLNQQTSALTIAMTTILKQFKATPPPASVKAVEEIYVTCGGAHPYYQCLAAGGNTFPKLQDNIQGYVAAAAVNYNQGNSGYRPSGAANQIRPPGELKAITTRSGIVLNGPSVPIPPPFINPEEDEHVEETLTDQDLTSIPSSELKCKALADLRASINLMPLSIWKNLGIARDVFVPVGKFTFLADFVIVDYESDPRVPFILGRHFLWTTRALIDVHGEEMIFYDGDEKLTLNMRHDTSSYSNQPQKESINLINVFNDSSEDFLENLFSINHQSGNPTFSSHLELTSPEVNDDIFDPEGGDVLIKKLLDLDSTKDLHPHHHVSTTSSSLPNQLLEEFADELALIIFPLGNDDLPFDIESDLKEIEYLLHQDPIKDMDSILKDLINQSTLMILMTILLISCPRCSPEMFTDEHALDYSSPPLYDEYDDDLFEVESDTKYVYNDPFKSKGEKNNESKLLIDKLDLSSDFLPPSEYDSFLSEDFFEVDALSSTNNEDKVFNPSILIQENIFKVITRVAPEKNEKKLAISHSSLILEDFDPPLYELPCFPGAARWWLVKEPSRSILTWEDLVSKFINEFFPPSRTTNLRNEISNFQQQFDESFHEALDRYKDLLRACPHHGFTELHKLDTFYNALKPANQDSLNSAAGGNLLERRTQDVLTIIENKSKCCDYRHESYSQTISSNPTSASVKSVEEICVTCGGAHPYYQCLAASGNSFLELQDNIQGYVAAAAVNYNQGNSGYRPPGVANQIQPPSFAQTNVQNNQNRFGQPQGYNRGNNFNPKQSYQAPTQQNPLSELEKIKRMNETNMKAMQTQINNVKNKLRNEMKNSIQASMSNQTNELKNMMASFFQVNTTFTSGSGSFLSNTIANPKGELKAITTRSGIC